MAQAYINKEPQRKSTSDIWHSRPFNKEQQSASTSARQSRFDQSGISNAIIKKKAYLAPRYISSDPQSDRTSGTAGHNGRVSKVNIQLAQLQTKNTKWIALLEDTVVSTRAVYEPLLSKRKHIWLAQPYIKKEQKSESTSGRHSRVGQSGISSAISLSLIHI